MVKTFTDAKQQMHFAKKNIDLDSAATRQRTFLIHALKLEVYSVGLQQCSCYRFQYHDS